MLNRQGDLIYLDKDNNSTHTIASINAMANKKLIVKFDSTQACYIGFLTGIFIVKKLAKNKPIVKSKHGLTLVKNVM